MSKISSTSYDGFDVSLVPDTAVGYSMANGLVNKVIVGANYPPFDIALTD